MGMEGTKERRTTAMLEKSRRVTRGFETVLIMGALALAFCLAAPRAAHAQIGNLQIFAVNPLDFGSGTADDNEVFATCTETAALDPVLFYDNTVITTASTDIMLVTISAVGDTHGNNAGEVQCTVDGAPCKTGNIGSDGASGPGWVVLERNEADEHDNTVHYTWCAPIKKTTKNTHVVTLSLANLANGTCPNDVFLEQVNVIVEGYHAGASKIAKNACKSVGVGEPSS
jgi:hypothetical protein